MTGYQLTISKEGDRMQDRTREHRGPIHPAVLALALVAVLAGSHTALGVMDATTECLGKLEFDGSPAVLTDGSTLSCTDCDPACDSDSPGQANGTCTFDLRACVNQPADGCVAATTIKKSKMNPAKAGLQPVTTCAGFTSVTVGTKKKGKKAGKLKLKLLVKSADRPARVDKDKVTLECQPRPEGPCPTTTTSTVATTTTTTATFPPSFTCEPIVVGQPIAGTYQVIGQTGPKVCGNNATANKFHPCTTDAECSLNPSSPTPNSCATTPFVTAGGIPVSFPIGASTVFTIAAANTETCDHVVCIGCGNANATCTGISGGCAGNSGCISQTPTCCDQPRFTAPSFSIPTLGACSRIDQKACGEGRVNTSNPQAGDNEVNKSGDTSDPGADCIQGNGDDPAAKPCNTTAGGEGADKTGKVVRTYGNSAPDAQGIQYRFQTPQLSTTWVADNAGCPSTATYDSGETLLSQLLLQAEPSTAGATARFTDMDGDSCSFAGAAFGGMDPGPLDASPAGVPQPYDGSTGSVSVAVGFALSGFFPLFDIGFVAVTPNGPASLIATETCTCTPTESCPE